MSGGSWIPFAALFLLPDLFMSGYLRGPRTGAYSCNAFHTHALPGALKALGTLAGGDLFISVALGWFAHIGFDRIVGFGLKYPTGFFDAYLHRR